MVPTIIVNYFKLNFGEKSINPLTYLESIIRVVHITISKYWTVNVNVCKLENVLTSLPIAFDKR